MAVGIVAVLVATVPVVGDMLNFEPDSHMRSGGPPAVGLFGGSSDAVGNPGGAPGAPAPTAPVVSAGTVTVPSRGASAHGPGALPSSEPLVIPPDLVAGPVPGSWVTSASLSSARPWAANPPAGGGRTFSVNLPAPWTGGIRDFATIDIYLPPGY